MEDIFDEDEIDYTKCPDCGADLQFSAFGDCEWCNECGYSWYE